MESYTVLGEDTGVRIDKLISEHFPAYTRSNIQKLLKKESVLVNGSPVKSSYKACAGDCIEFEPAKPEEADILPEDIPLDILYEDQDIILINKPKGLVVHPAPGHYRQTLVNGLMYHCRDQLSGINGVLRPGIVHRIDMDTTGVIVACKNDTAHNKIAQQLHDHTITRKYRAIVFGNIREDEGMVDKPIGRHPTDRKKMSVHAKNSRRAVTHYHVLERFGKYTYIECQLETGRTHQIRVHMASIGHPLLGDLVYGPDSQPFKLEGQMLHAMVLGLIHPSLGTYMEFTAPLPVYFNEILNKLRQNSQK